MCIKLYPFPDEFPFGLSFRDFGFTSRLDKTARTYERVATSHGRWVWSGADDLAWASRAWTFQLASLRGKASLWEGGLFGRLMRSPEAVAAARPGLEGVVGGVDQVRKCRCFSDGSNEEDRAASVCGCRS